MRIALASATLGFESGPVNYGSSISQIRDVHRCLELESRSPILCLYHSSQPSDCGEIVF
jgi:hypothetical protein